MPAAVSAFSADQLRELAVTNLEDINSLAPNIKVNPGRATSNTINAYIRGIGQNDPLWGFEPGVGIYIDDVYVARPQGALLDVYDVQRIEILRGPQGTLYGKNTLAGAIKYVTRDIVGEPAFNATVAGGSYGQMDLKLGGSTPIGEHVYVGASVAKLTRDGFEGDILAVKHAIAISEVMHRFGSSLAPWRGSGWNLQCHPLMSSTSPTAWWMTRPELLRRGGRGCLLFQLLAACFISRLAFGVFARLFGLCGFLGGLDGTGVKRAFVGRIAPQRNGAHQIAAQAAGGQGGENLGGVGHVCSGSGGRPIVRAGRGDG